MMKYLLALLLALFSFQAGAEELYSPLPYCAVVRNESDRRMNVIIRTDYYTKEDGSKDRFETNMRLEKGQFQEICAKGPFYPDYKIILTITAMFPLFECRTKLQGEIPLRVREENGDTDVYAVCVE